MSNKDETQINTIKPRSVRLSDETAEDFKRIAEQIGGNQQHALSELIRVYDSQIEKNTLIAGADLLEAFENYQAKNHDLFVQTLKLRNDATELAKVEFAKQLDSKDETIISLQNELKNSLADKLASEQKAESIQAKFDHFNDLAEISNQKLKEGKEKAEAEVESLKATIEELKADRNRIASSESEIRRLYDANVSNTSKLQKEIESLRATEGPIKDNLGKVTAENKILIAECNQAKQRVLELKKDIESLKTSHAAELELIRTQTELKLKNELNEQLLRKQEEIDKIKDKYVSMIENTKK